MTKTEQIASELRQEIVLGRFQPGGQVPSRLEICDRYGAGPGTVQSAFDLLTQEGFIEARRGVGTRVVDHPPHLSRYALAFSAAPTDSENRWSRMLRSLRDEGERLSSRGPLRIEPYFSVDGHEDSEDYRRLKEDVACRRLAGVIFATRPYHLIGHEILEQPHVPMVAIQSGYGDAQVKAVRFDSLSQVRLMAQAALDRGCRRVAVVSNPGSEVIAESGMALLEEMGLEVPRIWRLRVGLAFPDSAQDVVRLLLAADPGQRPEALIVGDDNLTDAAIAGVVEAGVRVPEQLTVISHCNFPATGRQVLPMIRVGFDVAGVFRTCLRLLSEIKANHAPPEGYTVPACYEHALPGAPAEAGLVAT